MSGLVHIISLAAPTGMPQEPIRLVQAFCKAMLDAEKLRLFGNCIGSPSGEAAWGSCPDRSDISAESVHLT